MEKKNLPTRTLREVMASVKAANVYWKAGQIDLCIHSLMKAWVLLPEPVMQWDYFPGAIAKELINCYCLKEDPKNVALWLKIQKAHQAAPETVLE